MAKVKVVSCDTSEYLTMPKIIDSYLTEAFEDGGPELIRIAMTNVAKSRNMTQLADEMGISRRGLYKMLSLSGNPELETIQKFISAIGPKLTVASIDKKRKSKIRKAIP